MTKTMLIDAANQEEVRVCVLENGKVEDFDFEYSSRKPLRGNIYLARVTRVEPSLQAAFVEYGGNRHGFLAFSEIHPDYYQVPVSDRRAIQEAEAEEAALAAALNLTQRGDDDDDDGGIDEIGGDDGDRDDAVQNLGGDDDDDVKATAAAADADDDENDRNAAEDAGDNDDASDDDAGEEEEEEEEEEERNEAAAADGDNDDDDSDDDSEPGEDASDAMTARASTDADDDADEEAEQEVGRDDDVEDDAGENARAEADGDDANEADDDDDRADEDDNAGDVPLSELSRSQLLDRYKEARRKKARLLRNYKIQEVIKRRQILLIQVVKEERGNKGAALTTYLSLAGRYCVLMPNTARGGGISRKIPVAGDRKRLRRVVDGLDVPEGMGLIIRTAGAKRTKAEIKRDYEYLVRLWENIRALTLKSIAPSLIYEEANLIKRAIRDLYDKDINKVLVEGEAGYREAKDFMKMLMPSHAKNVQPYKETAPLFLKYNVESQLDAMYQPTVRLKSGGYIVINQTEALIAIDVNSGKATRERNIEQTALRTNLEAADEAARQCRMRDLAGLIVIDFIDMDEQRNNRAVERRLKEALKNDRARIQLGRISNFGLLEMSRQRRRSGIVDGTTHACPTCGGAGAVRSQEMAALRILRAVESEAISSKAGHLQVRAALDVALYVLNHKRDWLARISNDYGVTVEITADSSKAGDQYEVEKTGVRKENHERQAAVRADSADPVETEAEAAEDDIAARTAGDEKPDSDDDGESRRGKRRRRRKRKDAQPAKSGDEASASDADAGDGEQPDVSDAAQGDDENGKSKKRRRRGRRGGRRSKRDQNASDADAENSDTSADAGAETDNAKSVEQPASDAAVETGDVEPGEIAAETQPEAGPVGDAAPEPDASATEMASPEPENEDAPAAPEPTPQAAASAEPEPVEVVDQSPTEPKGPPKKGWWQRAVGG